MRFVGNGKVFIFDIVLALAIMQGHFYFNFCKPSFLLLRESVIVSVEIRDGKCKEERFTVMLLSSHILKSYFHFVSIFLPPCLVRQLAGRETELNNHMRKIHSYIKTNCSFHGSHQVAQILFCFVCCFLVKPAQAFHRIIFINYHSLWI